MPPQTAKSLASSRLTLVRSIVRSTRSGTRARALAVNEAALKVVLLGGAGGKRGTISTRTLRRWIKQYETKGAAGLVLRRQHRHEAEEFYLSPAWDTAMLAIGADELTAVTVIADAVRVCIRAAWTVTGGGWRRVQRAVLPIAAALSGPRLSLSGPEMESLCTLHRRTIERDRPRPERRKWAQGRPKTRE